MATFTNPWKAEEWFVHYMREQGIYYKPREGWNMVDIDIVSASRVSHGTSIHNIVSSNDWKTERDPDIIPKPRAVFVIIIFATSTLIILVIFFTIRTIRDLTKKH